MPGINEAMVLETYYADSPNLLLPFFKKGAKAMGKQAMKTGMNIAQEAMLGQNIRKAAKRHLSQGLTELVTQHGRG